VELIKGSAPGWPRLEDDDYIMTVGSSRPLEDAWRVSQVEMIAWLTELFGLHRMDAYQLVSQISETPLANVVDPNYSVVAKARKTLLPGTSVFDGLHQDLRTRAADLTGA
jgi:acetamidase/formamidase